MSRDYKRLSTNNDNNLTRNVLILMIVAFVGGTLLAGWLFSRYDPFNNDEATAEPLTARADANVPAAATPDAEDASADAASISKKERALAVRVADLEDRLSRINVQARAAGGNAARAEGLLIAFAARRALDRGLTLGYIEPQLRLRFGEAQPKAVTTIVNASLDPVTLEELAGGLDELAPTLTIGSGGKGFWYDFKREMSELFVIRLEGTPSTVPQQRILRAARYLEVGNVEAAITEMEKLPAVENGDEKPNDWMEMARRYNEARRALDVIETAAILETHQLRSGNGERVDTPSALKPDVKPIPAP